MVAVIDTNDSLAFGDVAYILLEKIERMLHIRVGILFARKQWFKEGNSGGGGGGGWRSEVEGDWCVAKPGAPDAKMRQWIDFVCSQLYCGDILPGGDCYLPNDYFMELQLLSHTVLSRVKLSLSRSSLSLSQTKLASFVREIESCVREEPRERESFAHERAACVREKAVFVRELHENGEGAGEERD
ncbi:hypothetical protein LguiB_009637 [Lonicera macranthoides]